MSTMALLLVVLFLSIYSWLCSVGLSLGLLRLFPRFDTQHVTDRLFSPMWEVTNVFLVVGCAAFAVFFDGSLRTILHDERAIILTGLGALVIRISLAIHLFYRRSAARGLNLENSLYVLANMAVPVALSGVGATLLTGDVFWHTATGWVLVGMQLIGMMALAVGFMYWRAGRHATNRLRWASRLLIFVFAAVAAVDLQAAVQHISPHLYSLAYAVLVVLIACSVLWEMALLSTKRSDRGMWWYVSGVALVGPLLLIVANRPWLFYGRFTLPQVYVGTTADSVALASFSLAFVAVMAGMGVLARAVLCPAEKK